MDEIRHSLLAQGLALTILPYAAAPVLLRQRIRIVVRGKGCHGAMPHLGIDRCRWPVSWCKIPDHSYPQFAPTDAGVISVSMIEVSETTNVIPETATCRYSRNFNDRSA